MEIIRENSEYLNELLTNARKNKSVLLLEGARQVGKTHLAKHVVSKISNNSELKLITLNLETDKVLRSEIDDCLTFTEFSKLLARRHGLSASIPTILFIDEAQESKMLGGFVRSMKEEWSEVTSLLSGSSMSRLFGENTRIPVGRIHHLTLGPFSFKEFLSAQRKQGLVEILAENSTEVSPALHTELMGEVDKYLLIGGLPAVVRESLEGDYKLERKSLLLSQEEDFLRKESTNMQHLFRDALRGVATHVGSSSSFNHVSERTDHARKILNQLRSWHLILELEQRGINTSTAFHPKRYLYDLGILHDVRAAPFPNLSVLKSLSPILRTDIGGLLENFVLLQLRNYQMGSLDISSWKKNNKERVEVDFVIGGDIPIPIECKAALKLTSRTFKHLLTYLELTGLNFGIIISAAPYQDFMERGKRIVNIPFYMCDPARIINLQNQ